MIFAISRTKIGELSIFGETLLGSFFPILTILAYASISPLFAAAISTAVAAVFFGVVITVKRGWGQLRRPIPWKNILLATLCIGIIFYTLMFIGLRYTTAGNMRIMSQMEVFFSFFILGFLLKHERITPMQILGSCAMVFGALLILLPSASGWHPGDILIVLATAFAPIGNFFAQRARRAVSSEFIMLVRSIVSSIFFLLFALIVEELPDGAALSSSFGFLLINGVCIFGLTKILWIEGVHRIPISKAISIATVGPFFTLVFAYLILGESVTFIQILSLIPILFGVILLTRKSDHLNT